MILIEFSIPTFSRLLKIKSAFLWLQSKVLIISTEYIFRHFFTSAFSQPNTCCCLARWNVCKFYKSFPQIFQSYTPCLRCCLALQYILYYIVLFLVLYRILLEEFSILMFFHKKRQRTTHLITRHSTSDYTTTQHNAQGTMHKHSDMAETRSMAL